MLSSSCIDPIPYCTSKTCIHKINEANSRRFYSQNETFIRKLWKRFEMKPGLRVQGVYVWSAATSSRGRTGGRRRARPGSRAAGGSRVIDPRRDKHALIDGVRTRWDWSYSSRYCNHHVLLLNDFKSASPKTYLQQLYFCLSSVLMGFLYLP